MSIQGSVSRFIAEAIPTPEVFAKAAGRAAIGTCLIWIGHWMEWATLAGKMMFVLAAICLASHVESVVAARSAIVVRAVVGILALPAVLIAAAVLVNRIESDRENGVL